MDRGFGFGRANGKLIESFYSMLTHVVVACYKKVSTNDSFVFVNS